jgi:hypothetical protein
MVERGNKVTVLNTIGRTRLIPLQHIVPEESARILVNWAVPSS